MFNWFGISNCRTKKIKKQEWGGKKPNKEVQQLIGILEKNEDNGYEGMVEENFVTEMKKWFPRIEHRAFPEQSHEVPE